MKIEGLLTREGDGWAITLAIPDSILEGTDAKKARLRAELLALEAPEESGDDCLAHDCNGRLDADRRCSFCGHFWPSPRTIELDARRMARVEDDEDRQARIRKAAEEAHAAKLLANPGRFEGNTLME